MISPLAWYMMWVEWAKTWGFPISCEISIQNKRAAHHDPELLRELMGSAEIIQFPQRGVYARRKAR